MRWENLGMRNKVPGERRQDGEVVKGRGFRFSHTQVQSHSAMTAQVHQSFSCLNGTPTCHDA